MRYLASLTTTFLMLAYFSTNVALAQNDWLKKGKDLLGNIGAGGGGSALANSEIAAGLKQALDIGTSNVVSQLGVAGGFSNDPAIHIPLPSSLNTMRSALGAVGMGATMDDLEQRLNRAAEIATPKAKQLFVNAIAAMTLDDAKGILNGPDDSATRYFQKKMTPELVQEMRPIVNQSLAEAGAVQSYDTAMGEYSKLPFVPDLKANLTDYVVEKGTGGIFHYLAIQEAEIRANPAKHTTDLLKRVFGKG